jgi:hypothetical protein
MIKEDRSIVRCRRCQSVIPEGEARYIRMRVVNRQWLREITKTPTEIGPFCAACIELEFNPA